jgi:hypothetical protein
MGLGLNRADIGSIISSTVDLFSEHGLVYRIRYTACRLDLASTGDDYVLTA